jgi:hypothetical protein
MEGYYSVVRDLNTEEYSSRGVLCVLSSVREHLLWRHPTLEPSEEQAQQIVSTRAYDLQYAEVGTDEEFAFEPYGSSVMSPSRKSRLIKPERFYIGTT